MTSPTLQPFVNYLQGRWQAGCTNVAQLQRQLEAQGYQGSYSLLVQALMPWRGPRPPPEPGRPRIKRVNVRWLCLRPPEQLEPHEKDALQEILDGDECLASGYELLQWFRRLIVRRTIYAGVFPPIAVGEYIVLRPAEWAGRNFSVTSGQVTEIDWT